MSKIKDNLAGNDFIRRTILSILEVRGLIKLSDKKKKIIYNILDGKSTIQIGKEMGVSSTLVSYYWKEICTEMYKEVNNFSNRYSHLKKIEKENVHLKSQNRILNNRLGKKVDLENEELTVKLIDYNLSVRTINALYGIYRRRGYVYIKRC